MFDAGSNVNWGYATWTANLPAGTTITVLTSSSTDGTNWSDWSTVTNGGTITSPNGRYLRYEVLLTTTDPDGRRDALQHHVHVGLIYRGTCR